MGKSFMKTDKLKGILKNVLLDSEAPINIRISLAEYPDIKIYENVNFVGRKVFIPLMDTTSNDANKFNFTQNEWALNDELLIEISGVKNTNCKVKFRLEE